MLQYVVFGTINARVPPWQLHATDCSGNSDGTGVVDILQADKSCVGQGRSRSSNAAERYHAFFIRDRRHCIDYIL